MEEKQKQIFQQWRSFINQYFFAPVQFFLRNGKNALKIGSQRFAARRFFLRPFLPKIAKRSKTLVYSTIILLSFSFTAHALTLKDAQRDYLAGNYEEAIAKANRLRENDEVLYFLGLVYIKNADYTQARNYLGKLIQHFPKSAFYDQAAFKLADIYFLENEYEKAQGLYQQLEKDSSQLQNKSLLYLRLAQIAGRQGDWEAKNKYIRLIKEKYSGGPEIKFVQILESYGDFFTVQAGAFTERKNALSLSEELIAKGYESAIVEDEQGAYLLYKVRIGRYKSRYEAKKIAEQLLDSGYPAKIYP